MALLRRGGGLITSRPLLLRAAVIALFLLVALVLLAGLGFGGYLLFRPDSPDDSGSSGKSGRAAPERETTAPAHVSTTAPSGKPSGDTGSAATSVEGPRPGSEDDLRTTARDYVDAVSDRNAAAATALTCERKDPGTLYSVAGGREVRLGEVEVLGRTVGTADVTVGGGETALLLENRAGGWCVSV